MNWGFRFNCNMFTNPCRTGFYPLLPGWQAGRPVYMPPVLTAFPKFPIWQTVNFTQLPVWNYSPQPIYMTPYSQTKIPSVSLNSGNSNAYSSNNDVVFPEPTVSLEKWVSDMKMKYVPQSSKNSAKQTQNFITLTSTVKKNSLTTASPDFSGVKKPAAAQTGNTVNENIRFTTHHGSKTTKTLSVDFVNRVKEIAAKVKCDYRDLLGVMNSESGLSTTIRNKKSEAVGLIQFTDIAIRDLNQAYGLNLTKDKIGNMSAMEQLDLVEKYLTRAKSFKFKADKQLDSADLYAIVYRPAFAGKDIIAAKSDGLTYSQNKGLDLNKDGMITRDDLAQVVENKRINVNLCA